MGRRIYLRSPAVTPPAPPEAATALGLAGRDLLPGETAEFEAGEIPDPLCRYGSEPIIYWGTKFHWDAVRDEAQLVGVGVGFGNFRHALYRAAPGSWDGTAAVNAADWFGAPLTRGHPYNWHTMSPDGTYWLQRGSQSPMQLQYRRRSDWSTIPWPPADATDTFTVSSPTSWPQQIEWFPEINRAVYRQGREIRLLDLMSVLAGNGLGITTLPTLTTLFGGSALHYATIRYCKAMQSVLIFGGANHTTMYQLRYTGVGAGVEVIQLPGAPLSPMSGGGENPASEFGVYCQAVDDPLGQHFYLLERNPIDLDEAFNNQPMRVFRSNNTGPEWNGTWTEVGTHELFGKPRQDERAIGGWCFTTAVPRKVVGGENHYGVVWGIRQGSSNLLYTDSFIWKPPT